MSQRTHSTSCSTLPSTEKTTATSQNTKPVSQLGSRRIRPSLSTTVCWAHTRWDTIASLTGVSQSGPASSPTRKLSGRPALLPKPISKLTVPPSTGETKALSTLSKTRGAAAHVGHSQRPVRLKVPGKLSLALFSHSLSNSSSTVTPAVPDAMEVMR